MSDCNRSGDAFGTSRFCNFNLAIYRYRKLIGKKQGPKIMLKRKCLFKKSLKQRGRNLGQGMICSSSCLEYPIYQQVLHITLWCKTRRFFHQEHEPIYIKTLSITTFTWTCSSVILAGGTYQYVKTCVYVCACACVCVCVHMQIYKKMYNIWGYHQTPATKPL